MPDYMQYPPVSTNRSMWQYPPMADDRPMRQYPPMTTGRPMMDEMDLNDMEPVLRLSPQDGLNSPAMEGSMQEALADNIGLYAVCEFVVGTQEMSVKAGILYSVGRSFLVLYDEQQQHFTLCDIFSIKFVTLYMPGHRPWSVSRTPPVPMVDVPGVGSVPAGPYGIGTGSTPHLQNMPRNRTSFALDSSRQS